MKYSTRKKIKKVLVRLPGFVSVFTWLTRSTPRIFMFHRFSHKRDTLESSITAANFEKILDYLINKKYNIISLSDYLQLRRSTNSTLPPKIVIITVDDGYKDFYDVAYPILRDRKLPATFFVTSNFANGNFWLWHDRLHFILENTHLESFTFELNGQNRSFSINSHSDIAKTWSVFSEYCVQATNNEKWQIISTLEKTLDATLPSQPPAKYTSVSWKELREMAANNIEIGAHTCTHPILSKIPLCDLTKEITSPKKEIEEKVGVQVFSFCYPNGTDRDISNDVINTTMQAGYLGAVQSNGNDFSNIFRLARLSADNNFTGFLWKLSGLKMLLDKYSKTNTSLHFNEQ